MLKSIRLAALGLLALAGCATPPRSPERASLDPSVTVPATWQESAADDAGSLTGWLDDFGDPTLPRLVRDAMDANPDLRQTAARIQAARAQLAISHAARLPVLDADAAAGRSRRVSVSGNDVDGEFVESFEIGLGVDWEWDLWGRLALRDAAAFADFEAASWDLHAAQLSLAARLTSAWLTATSDRMQLELARATLANYEAIQTIIERRYEAAQTTALDVRLGRATVAEARGDVAAAERACRASVRAVEILLGRYPSGSLDLPASLPTLRHASVPAGMPAQLLTRRPDLAAAERRLAAATAELQAERLNRLPSIRLSSSTGSASEELEKLLDPEFLLLRLGLNLAAPILDGGRREALQDVAHANLAAAQATYAGAALDAFGDVEVALANEPRLLAELQAIRDAAEQYAAAEDLARDQYGQGLVDVTTLLDAQRRTVSARSRVIDAHLRRLQNRVQLYAALGGDFDTTQPVDQTAVPVFPN